MTIELTAEEQGHLSRIFASGRSVSRRPQFFSWVQGSVQALVPHEIFLCGLADTSGSIRHERFNACRYFRDEHYVRVMHPGNGLLARSISSWSTSQPVYMLEALPGDPAGWGARLAELELKNFAFHGVGAADGLLKGYAAFSRIRVPLDERLALCVEILLPYILSVLARVLAQETRVDGQATPSRKLITSREAEVLRWVRDGKTNDEIAEILGLSMLTVKNHLRNIMKKLVVRTRGQAVAKAISLGLLSAQRAQGEA